LHLKEEKKLLKEIIAATIKAKDSTEEAGTATEE